MKKYLTILAIIVVASLVVFAANKANNVPSDQTIKGENTPNVSVANIYGSKTNMDSTAFGSTGTTTVLANLGARVDKWQLKVQTTASDNFKTDAPTIYFFNQFSNDNDCAASSTDPAIEWYNLSPAINNDAMADSYAWGTSAAPVHSFTAASYATSSVALPMEDLEAMAKCVKTTFYTNSTTAAYGFQVDLIKREVSY